MKKKIDVDYIADLARIRLNKREIKSFSSQIGDIISYIEKLKKVDTIGVSPTTHPLPVMNVFRKDEVKGSLPAEEVLKNAPKTRRGAFKVPKIIEEG